MRVLICGDRNWTKLTNLFEAMDELHEELKFTLVIEGEARGADTLGRKWAEERGIEVMKFPADWKKFGRAAGPIRNRQMLSEGKPNLVVGFHNNISESKGTRDMLTRARRAGIQTLLYPPGQESALGR